VGRDEKISVTVVVHTYNQEAYISQCLKSILMQDFKSDILVIDDCSTDKTLQVCETFRIEYAERIRVVTSAQNEYQKGRLVGFEPYLSINTKYISWCDGDDYWIDKSKISKQISILQKDLTVGIVHSDYLILRETLNGNEITARPANQIKNAAALRDGKQLVNGNIIKHSTAMIAREDIDFNFVGGAQGIFAGDWLTYISATRKKTIHYLNEQTAIVRVTKNGMWNGVSTATHREQKDLIRWYCAATLQESDLREIYRRKVFLDWLKSNISKKRMYVILRPTVKYFRKARFSLKKYLTYSN
jgi:glycosyltransferase involved in cell wall biosynthesis